MTHARHDRNHDRAARARTARHPTEVRTRSLTHRNRIIHQAAAHLLDYPEGTWHDRLPLIRRALEAVGGREAAGLRRFLEYAEATPAAELEAHYVEVFDFNNRHSLYLTWWLDGDTRRRGASLVELKQAFRAAGLAFSDTELPDFLPAVLEFGAATGDPALLLRHRPGLELLRIALSEDGTPYAHVVAAVCATLPGPSPKDRAAARALAEAGPPRESVGRELLPIVTL